MALQKVVDSVPEGLETHYQEKEGKFHLVVEGEDDLVSELTTVKTKLEEFRANNIKLMKQNKELSEKAGTATETPDIDALVNQAVAEINNRNKLLADQNVALQSQLEEIVLSDRVKDAAIKHGVHESALVDVVTRAKGVFAVKDGKPIPKNKERDGDGEVMSPEKWIETLAASAPHLFKPSTGSNARRSNAPGGNSQELSSTEKIAAGLNKVKGV